MSYKRILISRTDGIGDVVLALPVAGVLKHLFPQSTIIFMGRNYTKPIADSCSYIDEFIAWDDIEKHESEKERIKELKKVKAEVIVHIFPRKEIATLAKKTGIPLRVGTSNRYYHWLTCNSIIKLSRKSSPHHEAQLNLKLLFSLGAKKRYEKHEIPKFYGLTKIEKLKPEFYTLLDNKKFNLIIHPKSKGSAREWGMKNYSELIKILPEDKFKIFISGTEEEQEHVKLHLIDPYSKVTALPGNMPLSQFISFIAAADGVLAASTGPLHIAAALGKVAVGLYAPMRPIHPGRWAPLGLHAYFLVKDKKCNKCRKKKHCECIESISPETVKQKLIHISEI
ncbi:MAG TPA: glycosyltransferase family 9 protein [Bacteroidales bacterium]|nr:glycosyltransferase family 9 protein [Bacteroidales bacterium]HPS16799.1 glycosyltransferase family 9 protein [Bacteroidales bacterium]